MNRRNWLALTALLGLLPLVARAQEPVKFEVKIAEGEKSTSVVTVNTKQTLNLAGMALESGSEQEMKIVTVNGTRGEDGVIRQQQSIEALRAKLTLPGGIVLAYDSTQPEAPAAGTQFDALLDLIKINAKSTWTVVRGKDNRVIAVEGRDKVLEGLDEAQKAVMKKQLDPMYLRDAANKELERLPSKPVAKGDSWEVTQSLRLEQGQNMTFKTKYTYEGTADRNGKTLDHIDVKVVEVSYGVDADAAIPLKVTGADLKPAETSGAIYFDREKGTEVESSSKVRIQGTINFEVNGMAVPAQLDLTMANSSVMQ